LNDALTPDQNGILIDLLRAWDSAPKEERSGFRVMTWDGDDDRPFVQLDRTSYKTRQYVGDLEELEAAGFLRVDRGPHGIVWFRLSNAAHRYRAELAAQAGSLGVEIEQAVRLLVDAEALAERYPDVRMQLALAQEALAHPRLDLQLKTVGHYCRDALQAYAAHLVAEFPPPRPEPDPAKTKNRLAGVIQAVRTEVGDRDRQLLEALLVYWDAANGLFQRQLHGKHDGDEPLTTEDARRTVFHTYLVIYECERTLARLRRQPTLGPTDPSS